MKLACMGDSLTNGHGLPPEKCWTSLLSNSLQIEVVNYGISGDTTGGMVGRFNHMLITETPSHVFIMGGTNDLSFGLPDNIILSNIKAMSRQARYLEIPFIIGIPSTFYPSGEAKLYEININEFEARLKGFQYRLKQFVHKDQCQSIDFSHGLDRNHFLEDGIHPNSLGQEIMSFRAEQTIKTLL